MKETLENTILKLNNMYNYGKNWDGYEAIAPIPEIIECAKKFCYKLIEVIPEKAVLNVFVDGTSDISFYFNDRVNKNYIEISIYNKDNYCFFVDTQKQSLYGKDDISLEIIDDDLLNSIQLMYED